MRKLELLAPAHVAVRAREAEAVPAAFEARVAAIAEALFANESGPPDPKRIAWVCADFADFVSRAQGRGRLVMLLSVWFLTWIAPFVVRRFGPLGDLPIDKRVDALERVEASSVGFIALAPKAMLCMMWFEHPDTQRETKTEITCLK
jgi:hypothetical protein